MLTVSIDYKNSVDVPEKSRSIIGYIKRTLAQLVGTYTQKTDSALRPTSYTFTARVRSQTAQDVKKWIELAQKETE